MLALTGVDVLPEGAILEKQAAARRTNIAIPPVLFSFHRIPAPWTGSF
jgi:hypothetical protein